MAAADAAASLRHAAMDVATGAMRVVVTVAMPALVVAMSAMTDATMAASHCKAMANPLITPGAALARAPRRIAIAQAAAWAAAMASRHARPKVANLTRCAPVLT